MQLRLAGTFWPLIPVLLIWSVLAAVPRAGLSLLLGRPGRARDELLALGEVLLRPDRWVRSRWRARRVRRVPRRSLRPLFATTGELVRRRRDEAAAWILPRQPASADAARQPSPGYPGHPAGPDDEHAVHGALYDLEQAGALVLAPRGADPDAFSDDDVPDHDADVDHGAVPDHGAVADHGAHADPPRPAALTAVALEAGPAAEEAESLPVRGLSEAQRRRWFALLGALPAVLIAAVAGLTGLHRLIGLDGTAVGPYLLPAPPSAAALWHAAGSFWRPSGLGAAATADPLDGLLAALSLPLGAVPGRLIDLLLLAGLPLAAGSAWLAAGALTSSRLARGWAALVWAACPPLLMSVSTGRVGSVLAHILLPVAVSSLARAAGLPSRAGAGRSVGRPVGRPERSLRPVGAGCLAGLLLTAVLAGAPSLVLPVLVAVLGAGVLAGTSRPARRGDRIPLPRRLVPPAAAIGVPFVLLLPWWTAVARDPRLLLADPGSVVAGPSIPPPAPWWHLLMLTSDPLPAGGSAPAGTLAGAATELARLLPAGALWQHHLPGPARTLAIVFAVLLAGPVLLFGLLALLRRDGARTAAAGWLLALSGLGTALVAGRVVVGATGEGLGASGRLLGWWGPGLSLFALGALAAALALVGRGRRSLSPGRTVRLPGLQRWVRGAAVTLAALVGLLGPLVTLGAWSWQAVAAPGWGARAAIAAPLVGRADPDVLPAVAADEAEGDAGARTLVLRADRSTVRWTLARAAGPRLSDDSAALAARRLAEGGNTAQDSRLVVPAVAALLGDGGDDVRVRLAELGIGSVLLVQPVSDEAVLALDASPGLVRVTTTRTAVLWRVELAASGGAPSRPARVRIVDNQGTTLSALPSAGADVDTRIPAGPLGRVVVLTDRADAGWQATLDGHRLDPVTTSGWAQAFVLPTEGGGLRISYDGGLPVAVGALQSGVLAVAVLGLLPLPRLRRRVAVPAPPQFSRPVPRVTGSVLAAEDLPPMPQVFDQDHPEEGDVAPLFTDDPDDPPTDPTDDPPTELGGPEPGELPSWVLQPADDEAAPAEPTDQAESAEPDDQTEPATADGPAEASS